MCLTLEVSPETFSRRQGTKKDVIPRSAWPRDLCVGMIVRCRQYPNKCLLIGLGVHSRYLTFSTWTITGKSRFLIPLKRVSEWHTFLVFFCSEYHRGFIVYPFREKLKRGLPLFIQFPNLCSSEKDDSKLPTSVLSFPTSHELPKTSILAATPGSPARKEPAINKWDERNEDTSHSWNCYLSGWLFLVHRSGFRAGGGGERRSFRVCRRPYG